ncbi:DUF4145 domain-containing protein [Rhodococcus rhodochrous]|uniref:DUF4145 domain-containing protein n=1 Tax=Rhodococcus rhodochrous TaxID=1829 RepID=UPI0024B958B3|nr:DUF4145 domain-containing protein [Rhodococcus rhodochrous]MDJ0399665.1 DUF4145 domain-containing protein [Rhodococcus rhodochrous]
MAAEEVKSKAILVDAAGNTNHDDREDREDRPERNPDTLPTSRDPSGMCPRCGRVSNFTPEKSVNLYGTVETMTPLECQGCRRKTVVIEKFMSVNGGPSRWQGVHWWPVAAAVVDMADVPSNLASAFQEGVRCVSVEAPHAAVAMFRNALAQIVQDKGSEQAKKKDTLNLAIKQMVVDRTLHDGFAEWADHVRKVGNAGAHQESWDEIPLEQAQELQDLVKHLIDSLYVQPAKLARAMPARKRPKP